MLLSYVSYGEGTAGNVTFLDSRADFTFIRDRLYEPSGHFLASLLETRVLWWNVADSLFRMIEFLRTWSLIETKLRKRPASRLSLTVLKGFSDSDLRVVS